MSGNDERIKRLIDRLGGQNATARLANCRQSEVWRWIRKNRVPSSRIPTLIENAAKLEPPVHLAMSDFFTVAEQPPSAEAA